MSLTPALTSSQWRTAARGGRILTPGASVPYESARRTRRREWRPTVTVDESEEITPYIRRQLMSNGRWLFRNSGLFGGAVEDTANYAVADGILPLPLTADEGANEDYRQAFLEWADVAHVGGRDSLWEMAYQATIGMEVDGDLFPLLTSTDPGNPLALPRLQLIRAHRIGSQELPKNDGATVEYDGVIWEKATGQRVGYRLLSGDVSGAHQGEVLPADYVLHLARNLLSDSVRGVSQSARGGHKVFDSEEALAAMRLKVKHEAARLVTVTTALGSAEGDDDEEDADLDEPRNLEDFADGEILYLGPGEKVESVSGSAPHETFTGFIEFSHRDFGNGYGLPLEFLWKADLSGASLRFMLTKTQRRINVVRNRTLIPRFMIPIYRRVIAAYIARRELGRVAGWYRTAWQTTSADLTVDAGRDAQQNRADLVQGNRTLAEDAGERGKDWRVLRRQRDTEARDLIDRAKRISKDTGVSLEFAFGLLQQQTPNGLAVGAATAVAG